MQKIQQGDVLLMVATIPVAAKPSSGLVLAEGETTGHAHRVTRGQAKMLRDGERIFLRVLSGDATVTHEEHGPITLPRGDYEVKRVREYDHFAEAARVIGD